MSDARTEAPWKAFVCRITSKDIPTSSQTPEYDRESELLREAGYETGPVGRGMTHHETEAEARSSVFGMIRNLAALDPMVEWHGRVFMK